MNCDPLTAPKGHATAIAGVYFCLICKKSFRGFNKAAQAYLPDNVQTEMFDYMFCGIEMADTYTYSKIKIMRDNGVLFQPTARIINEEKIEAYWKLAKRWEAATTADRTLGTPPVSAQREAWREAHDGELVADMFPDVRSEAYGVLPISAHTVQLIYATLEAEDLEDKHLRMQKLSAVVMKEDVSYKKQANLAPPSDGEGRAER